MTAIELMERVGGEVLANKIRVTLDGEIVILACLDGNEWQYTEQGQTLVDEYATLATEEAAAAPKTRKKSAPAVESGDAPAETPAEEPAQTAAE